MKAYNRKRKPKHTTKSKYKVHFFRDVFWARYSVRNVKKESVCGKRKKKHLKKKRFKKCQVHISSSLYWYLNYKDKFKDKFNKRQFKV